MSVRYQKLYVSSARVLKAAAYCPTKAGTCKGRATVLVKAKPVASAPFAFRGGAHITLKLEQSTYDAVRRARGRKLSAVLRLKSQLGTAAHTVLLHQ